VELYRHSHKRLLLKRLSKIRDKFSFTLRYKTPFEYGSSLTYDSRLPGHESFILVTSPRRASNNYLRH